MWKLRYSIAIGLIVVFALLVIVTLVVTRVNEVDLQNIPLQQEWVLEAESDLRVTPIVYKERVLVRSRDMLYVVDAVNGTLLWSHQFEDDKHADPPLVQDDAVVVTHLNGTTAFELETGNLIWEVISEESRSDALPVASNEDIVVVVDNAILIRDINTGELLWTVDHPYPRSNAFVTIDGSSLVTVFRDQIRSYDLDTGELDWEETTDDWAIRNGLTGLLEDEILYLESREGGLSSYDVEEKRMIWARSDLSLGNYPIAKHKNTLLVGSKGAVPVALDSSTGETLWQASGLPDFDDYQTPLVLNDVVYIRSVFRKKIYALDLQSGVVVGSIDLGIPDIVSLNADYSLGPVRFDQLVIFPVGRRLVAYRS